MGWLDKTVKNIFKSPLGKAAVMGGLAMTPWGKGLMGLMGKHGGTQGMGLLKSLWAKPIISKPLTNAAMSYGLAKLMRARNPEKAAMWGAVSTLPFLGSSAYGHAGDLTDKGFLGAKGKDVSMWDVLFNKDVTVPSKLLHQGSVPFQMSDINPQYLDQSARQKVLTDLNKNALGPGKMGFDVSLRSKPIISGAADNYSYFMKNAAELEKAKQLSDKATGFSALLPSSDYNLMRAGLPLLAGTYGARETAEQKWQRIKEARKRQLAWMYGVDPDQITGEMTNPWYDSAPPALDFKYANQGGIMNLDNGGDISGPGTGTSDSINAKVSDGEFIFTNKAVENFGGGDRQVGARRMYSMMNQLDPQSQTPAEGMV